MDAVCRVDTRIVGHLLLDRLPERLDSDGVLVVRELDGPVLLAQVQEIFKKRTVCLEIY